MGTAVRILIAAMCSRTRDNMYGGEVAGKRRKKTVAGSPGQQMFSLLHTDLIEYVALRDRWHISQLCQRHVACF